MTRRTRLPERTSFCRRFGRNAQRLKNPFAASDRCAPELPVAWHRSMGVTNHLIYLSIPGLRPRDVADASITPTLNGWARAGALAEVQPSFPCVTSTVQASTWTGVGPGAHGVIANGFYKREVPAVEFWVGRNDCVQRRQIWDVIAQDGRHSSAVWHAQNIKGAAADYIVTPAPIHEPDGTTKLWCYSKPNDLYERILVDLGHFPLQHYWGPGSNIESSKWILAAARWLIQ